MQAGAKRSTLVVAVAVLLIAFLVWAVLHHREPVYNGKPLTDWAQQYGSNRWSGASGAAAANEAEFVIRQIGTNSIPFLIDLIRATDRPFKRKLRTILPPRWHDAFDLKDDSGKLRRIGAHGLAALGTNAPTAVHALIEVGKTHPDPDGRYIAVFALRNLRSAAEAAVPFYIQSLTNSDSTIRNEAAIGLVLVPRQWPATLPHLMKYLDSIKSTSGWEIMHAVDLFGMYLGTNAQPSVPILLSLLNHDEPRVRESVTNALPRIDPEVATKAGVSPVRR